MPNAIALSKGKKCDQPKAGTAWSRQSEALRDRKSNTANIDHIYTRSEKKVADIVIMYLQIGQPLD